MSNITPQAAQEVAKDAYVFAYSMLENYKTMYAFSVNRDLPSFRAPFNQFFHMRQLLGPEFTEVVGPNNDTLYSLAWLDLGTEPIVLSLPDIPDERYYVIQIVDMYTFNVEYIGDRTPGLKYNVDGSLDIYIQADSPGPDKESNWLPCPEGDFRPIMRIYQPRPEALDGTYVLPPIRRVG